MAPQRMPEALWNIKDIVILQFLSFLMDGLVALGQTFLVPPQHFFTPYFAVLLHLIGRLFFLTMLFYWIHYLYDLPLTYLGLNLKKIRQGAVLCIKLAVPLVALVIFLAHYPLSREANMEAFSPLLIIEGLESLAISLFYLLVLTLLFIPIALSTEVFYRGFVGSYFRKKTGSILGGFLSAIYFAIFMGSFTPGWFALYSVLGIILFHTYNSRVNLWTGTFYLAVFSAAITLYVLGFSWLF